MTALEPPGLGTPDRDSGESPRSVENRAGPFDAPPGGSFLGGWAEPAGFALWTALALVLLAAFVVRDLGSLLFYPFDAGQYHHTSAYFAHNVSWWPFPQLALSTDWSFYPCGFDHVFLHWAFERDLFVTTLTWATGHPGPWLQIYFLLSTAITATGLYLILRREAGPRRAALVAWASSFFNFYAIGKFPIHQPYSSPHWVLLGIALDYVLLQRDARGESARSAQLWLLRGFLLVASLGLELGYVAGYGITSFCLTVAWVLGRALLLRPRAPFAGTMGEIRAALWGSNPSDPGRRRRTLALTLATLAATWLHVPLALAVARAAKAFDFTGIPSYWQWANPLRLLVPILPGLDPYLAGDRLETWFGDDPETWSFSYAPGLSFVLLAALGWLSARGRRWPVTPLLALLAALLSFHPVKLPLLTLLPWFAFARVAGRASVILPLLLALLALGLPAGWPRSRRARRIAAALALLFVAEATTAYQRIVSARVAFPGMGVTPELERLGRTIAAAPGEALFEWPFLLAPSSSPLGAFYSRLGGASQLAVLHGKKGMGAYFGRLHPSELVRAEAPGWATLLLPDGSAPEQVRQRRDFTASEWRFLEEFVRSGDFAGILLYRDLLPAATVRGFHERFGPPAATAEFLPETGVVEFLPKPAAWRAAVDLEHARALRLERPVFPWRLGQRLELCSPEADDYLFEGWAPRQTPRWTERPVAVTRFALDRRGPLLLRLKIGTWHTQRLRARYNGTPLGEARLDGYAMPILAWPLPAELQRARNELVLEAPDAVPARSQRGDVLVGLRCEWIELLEQVEPGRAAGAEEGIFASTFETGGLGDWSSAPFDSY